MERDDLQHKVILILILLKHNGVRPYLPIWHGFPLCFERFLTLVVDREDIFAINGKYTPDNPTVSSPHGIQKRS